jgi:hypothetical protein
VKSFKELFNRPRKHSLEGENQRLQLRNTLLENEMDILVNKINGLADTARYIKEDIDSPQDMPNAYKHQPRITEMNNVKDI